MGSLIRATNLWGYSDLVLELGGDPGALLARFGVPAGVEQDPDAFVSFRSGARLVEATAAELDCADFGLRLSRWQGLDILGPLAVIARNEHTVRDALLAVARYLHVHSPALRLEVAPSRGRDLTFHYEISEPGMAQLRQCYELSMANFSRIVGLLAGPETHLGVVLLMHEQVGTPESYADALGCPVRFGQPRYGFEVDAALADRVIDSADETTRRIATKYLESELLPVEQSTLAEQVAALTRLLLPVGQCTAEAIAAELGMHPRTLQRRLAHDGLRCQDIIDVERQRQAVRYLAEPRLYLGQISRMLGFAEQSSLNRACLRWFGKTPRQYRAELALSG